MAVPRGCEGMVLEAEAFIRDVHREENAAHAPRGQSVEADATDS